jgi:hypothetical protein
MCAIVVFGVRYMVERSEKGKKKGRSPSDFDADWRPYQKYLIRDLSVEMRENRRLYVVGSVVNTGTRNLRNARVRVTVAATMRGAQRQMKVLNLGQILSGQERKYDKWLFTMPGNAEAIHPGLYKIEMVDMWFERKRREWTGS